MPFIAIRLEVGSKFNESLIGRIVIVAEVFTLF